ncbi:putative homeobox protein Meis3-like 1, partial [Dissostichus eleginoides]
MARDYPARCPVSPVRNTLLIAASILLAAQGPILFRNVNDDESPRRLGADEGLISLSHGEQAADDYHPQSAGPGWLPLHGGSRVRALLLEQLLVELKRVP